MSINQFAHQEGLRLSEAVRDFLFESLAGEGRAGQKITELSADLIELQSKVGRRNRLNINNLKENNG